MAVAFVKDVWNKQLGYNFNIEDAAIDPNRTLLEQFDETYETLRRLFYDDLDLLEYIKRAHEIGRFLIEIAPHFDYDDNTQANGYWTNVIMSIKISKLIASSDPSTYNREHLIHIFHVLNISSDLCQKIYLKQNIKGESINIPDRMCVKGTDLFDEDHLFASQLSIVDLLQLNQSLRVQLYTLYAYYNSCWLGPTMSRVMQFFTLFLSVYSTQYKSIRLYNFFSRFNRGVMFTNMAQNVNIDCLKSMWNMTENIFVKNFFSAIQYLSSSTLIESVDVFIPRQHRWQIATLETKVHDLRNAFAIPPKKKWIRAIYLTKKNCDKQKLADNKTVLLHIHGGGFISQSPETHLPYLREWVGQLEEVPILSVDYSLSPESPFPGALQEVLDCYLWLTSKHPSVKRKLGFFPEKIGVCGDSAGGNMTISLVLVLKHIQEAAKKLNEPLDQYRYPAGLFCFYTPLLLMTIVSPSRLMCSIDGLVPVGALLSCLGAYVPREVMLNFHQEEEEEFVNVVPNTYASGLIKSITELTDYYSKIAYKIFKFAKKTFIIKRGVPWYRRTETLRKTVFNLNQFLKNHFISPLLCNDFDQDIPLYLYALVYDSFLDDNIEIAKKWKGKTHIEIIDELPHGFLNLVQFNQKAKEASLLCIPHIKETLLGKKSLMAIN